jgi:hypothetical protein
MLSKQLLEMFKDTSSMVKKETLPNVEQDCLKPWFYRLRGCSIVIMDYLDLIDSSRKLISICAISFRN